MIIKLKVFYDLQGQTSRFMVWANGKQTSGLVNLPFAEISSLYLKKATEAWNWYQRSHFTYGTHISVWNILSRKTPLQIVSMLLEIDFSLEQPKKLCFIYIQTGFSGNLLQMVNNPEAHPDVQYRVGGWGEGSLHDPEIRGRAGLKKIFFQPFRPQFGLKISQPKCCWWYFLFEWVRSSLFHLEPGLVHFTRLAWLNI